MVRSVKVAIVVMALAGAPVVVAQQAAPPPPPTAAQAEPKAPELGEIQRQQVVIAVQQVEIWSLRLSQAQGELQKASEAAQSLVGSVCGVTHQLNLQTMKCDPKPAEPEKPKGGSTP